MLRADANRPLPRRGRALRGVAVSAASCASPRRRRSQGRPDDADRPGAAAARRKGLLAEPAPRRRADAGAERPRPAAPDARPRLRTDGRGDGLRRRPLPARRHLGDDRLRLQRLHAPRLRDEPRPRRCRGAPTSRRRAGLVAVKREDLRPGDLVFFNTLKRTFSHVGIYIGDNRFIHAPRSRQAACAPRT